MPWDFVMRTITDEVGSGPLRTQIIGGTPWVFHTANQRPAFDELAGELTDPNVEPRIEVEAEPEKPGPGSPLGRDDNLDFNKLCISQRPDYFPGRFPGHGCTPYNPYPQSNGTGL